MGVYRTQTAIQLEVRRQKLMEFICRTLLTVEKRMHALAICSGSLVGRESSQRLTIEVG